MIASRGAVISSTDQFRHRDFRQTRKRPRALQNSFAGFFGSLEEVNTKLRAQTKWKKSEPPQRIYYRATPSKLPNFLI